MIPIQVSSLALGSKHTFAYTTTINSDKTLNENLEVESNVFCWGSNVNYELGIISL